MPGHIKKRGKHSWTVVIEAGRDPVTGKRRQVWRAVKGTKKDAEKLLTQLLHRRDTGIEVAPDKITTDRYLMRWLRDYAQPNTAPKTSIRYEQLIRLHVLPSLGRFRLSELRPLHIQECYRRLGAKGLAPRTILQCHRVLRKALSQAMRWQLISVNPADSVDPPRIKRQAVKLVAADQIQAILDAANGTSYGDLVFLAMMTGLRRGELLGLRWCDIDLDARLLHVSQTVQRLPGQGIVFLPPKTHRSARPVALSPDTVDRLQSRRVSQIEERLAAGAAYEDHDLVFATPLGHPIDPANLRRAWTNILSIAGVGHLRFHDLRHAHATLLLRQGVHPKIVSERLGHAGVSITLDTYSHVLPGLQAEAAARLDKLFAPASTAALANG